MSSVPSFLVIQTAFLGDAILMTSILEKLNEFFPDARIDVVIRKGNEGIFGGRTVKGANRIMTSEGKDGKGYGHRHPFVEQVFVWDKTSNKNKNLRKLISRIRQTRYDHVINCQRFFSTGLLTTRSRSRQKIGYGKNPLSLFFRKRVKHNIGDGRHEVDRLNDLIEHLTDSSRPLPKLHPTEEDRMQVRRFVPDPTGPQTDFVTIAPASVWRTKQWPKEKWVELIQAQPAHTKVLLIGGSSDKLLCEAIVDEADRGHNLAGHLSILATASLIEQARVNYVNDSAPLHIASAMRAPVTAVFCSTVPAFGFGPLHENGRVVEANEELKCRPCGLHGKKECPKGHFRCANDIEVDQLRK